MYFALKIKGREVYATHAKTWDRRINAYLLYCVFDPSLRGKKLRETSFLVN
jgi:hypothetical protein